MGNVNMDATQIHNNDKNAPTVQQALDSLKQLSGNLSTLVGELAEDVLDKAEKTDIAPEFDDTATYLINDLVYHENQLYIFTAEHDPGEWNAEEVSAVNLNTVLDAIRANGGGAKLKTLKYTGTGTVSYTLDFGEDTPATILQIVPEPGESVITNNYEYLSGFAWGVPFTYGVWANKSNNLPTNHGGFNISTITFSNNTCTITGPSASAAANYEGQKYAVYYLA